MEGVADFGDIFSNASETNAKIDPFGPGGYYYYYYYDFDAFFNQFRFKLADFLWTRFSLVLAIVCILGNLVIILVLTQKTSRNFSTSIFICSLAFSDMFISVYLMEGFLISNGYIIKTYHEIDCLFRLYLPRTGSRASSLMLAVISIERAVSVKIPHKVKLIFTVKVARLLVALVWLIASSTTILTTYLYTFTTALGSPQCLIDSTNKGRVYTANFIIGKTLSIGSWLVNLVCMIFIIKALLKNVIDKSGNTRVMSVTKTLLIVNIVYFICVTPHVCYDTYIYIVRYVMEADWYFVDYHNHFNYNNILIMVNYSNNVSNFFIYFLSGAKFRKEMKDFFLSCCKRKHSRGRSIKK